MLMHRDGEVEPAFDTSVPVLVLRRSIDRFQHCALGIARSLGRVGVPVHPMRAPGFEPATRSRYTSDRLALSGDGPEPAWVDALVSLGGAFKGAILLPIDDLASVAVGDHRRRLQQVYRLPDAPPGIERRLASKRELYQLCHELDLPTPDSSFPAAEADLLAQAQEVQYPLIVKRAESWFPPRDPSAPSVAIVHDPGQLLRAYRAMESDVHPQVMLQQYIPGGSDAVWMFNGYLDGAGECSCAFTGRKLRQSGPQTGPTTVGVCEHNPEVVRLAERLLGAIGYRGIVDMGFRYDARDREYKLLDVNPRLGSTFRLFVSDGGVDVVRAMHLDLTGRPPAKAMTSSGRKWIDERGDLITSLRMARQGSLGARTWARAFRGVDETAWWAADDPWPFVGMGFASVPHSLRKLAGPSARRGGTARSRESMSDAEQNVQTHVDAYFDASAEYWNTVYASHEVSGRIYRRRMEVATAWAHDLELPSGALALDVGCGAGLMTMALARDGIEVTAMDSSDEMVRATARLARESGLEHRVTVRGGDVRELPFSDGTFGLIVALGLIPWLNDPGSAIAELTRVLEPGGWLIVTADNRRRLNRLVEPRESPPLRPLRLIKRRLSSGGPTLSHRHRPEEVDAMLRAAGVSVAHRATVGYGPFTVLGRPLLTGRVSCRVDERLQRASAEHRRLRGVGWHYVVAGEKQPGRPARL